MRSENFRFGFTKYVSKFVILREDVGKVRSLHKMYKAYLNIQRIKAELKLIKV